MEHIESSYREAGSPPQQQRHPAAGQSKLKRRRVVRNRRRRATPAPPGRLGWLGGGMATATTTMTTAATTTMTMTGSNDNNNGHADDFEGCDINEQNDHRNDRKRAGVCDQSSANNGRLLTPRADYHATDSGNAASIDLTGVDDDDEFIFKDSLSRNRSSDEKSLRNNGSKDDNKESNGRNGNHVAWTCRICTLENPQSSSICEVCNTRRESTRSNNIVGRKKNNYGSLGSLIQQSNDQSNGQSNSSGTIDEAKNQKLGSKKKFKQSNENLTRKSKKMPKSNSQSLRKWASSSQQSLSQQSSSSRTSIRKSKPYSSATSTTQQSSRKSTLMWIDKHAPRSAEELCVAPKKVEEVRRFLSSHASYASHARSLQTQKHQSTPWEEPRDAPPEAKLMILSGSPGVGKSATVRTLAKEMKLEVLAWNDAQIEYNFNRLGANDSGSHLPYQSQLASFENFLMQGCAGKESLHLETTLETTSSYDASLDEHHVGSLILVEEIPNLYNAEAAQSFRNIMERHVQRTQTPTFFIFSDVHEGKHKPDDLERLIPSHVLYSPSVQILPVQPVTKSKMKKCLRSIAETEGLLSRRKSSSLLLPAEFFEETHLASGGDLRHAIFAMQFRCARRRPAADIGGTRESNHDGSSGKDAKLSTFHALGKLLYAKRTPSPQQYDSDFEVTTSASSIRAIDRRGPLEFVPEDILNNIDMGVGSALFFLSYHSPDFFTDATDLSRSFDLLSDAALFADRFGQTDGPFPTEYASCIGGRAVADGNRNPAPSRFRQFTAPEVFGVMRKSRENEDKIERLRKRFSIGGGGRTSVHDNIGSAHHFVTDSLPFMRSVIPKDVNYALATLHSYAKESNGNISNEPQHDFKEENNVLLEDDLVDDNDW